MTATKLTVIKSARRKRYEVADGYVKSSYWQVPKHQVFDTGIAVGRGYGRPNHLLILVKENPEDTYPEAKDRWFGELFEKGVAWSTASSMKYRYSLIEDYKKKEEGSE